MATEWTVISEPVSENVGGNNRSGMTITLTNGERKKELGTVAWVRAGTANPKKKMGDVLQERVQQAQIAADELNKLEVARMQAAKDALEPVRAKLQAELDEAGGLLRTLAELDFDEVEANRDTIDAIAKLDFASVEAAVSKLKPLSDMLTAELARAQAVLEQLRQVDLFRLDKARAIVEALSNAELAQLEARKAAVLPLKDRLEAEEQAAKDALADYDRQVDDMLEKLAGGKPGKML